MANKRTIQTSLGECQIPYNPYFAGGINDPLNVGIKLAFVEMHKVRDSGQKFRIADMKKFLHHKGFSYTDIQTIVGNAYT